MIDKFIQTFYYPDSSNTVVSDTDFKCGVWRDRGEKNGFLLYNLWCSENVGDDPSAHHYYIDG